MNFVPSHARVVPGNSVPSNATCPSTVTRSQLSLEARSERTNGAPWVGVAFGVGEGGGGAVVAVAWTGAAVGATSGFVALATPVGVGDGGKVGIGVTVGNGMAVATRVIGVGEGAAAKTLVEREAVNSLYWRKMKAMKATSRISTSAPAMARGFGPRQIGVEIC